MKDTRRRFIHRTGAVGLSTYLGLGIIAPRRLLATDGSGVNRFLTGIKFLVPWPNPPAQGAWLKQPNEDTLYRSQQQSTHNVTDGLGKSGVITITTYNQANEIPGRCRGTSLMIETVTLAEVDITMQVGDMFCHYKGSLRRNESREFECINGVVTMLDEDATQEGGPGDIRTLTYAGTSPIPPTTYPNASSFSWIEMDIGQGGVRVRNSADSPADGMNFVGCPRNYTLQCCVP
jgi:hypothetical protein